MQNNPITVAIQEEFIALLDLSKEYTLKEFKDLASEIYKTKTGAKPKAVRKSKKNDDSSDDVKSDDTKPKKRTTKADKADKADKPKKKLTAYNVYVGERIKALKLEEPDVTAMERMKMAAAGWKTLSDDEKKAYIPSEE